MKLYHNSVEVLSCGECPNCKVVSFQGPDTNWSFYCGALRTEADFQNIENVTEYRISDSISPYCPLDDFEST